MGLFSKIKNLKFAPTLNQYEILRRFVGMMAENDPTRQQVRMQVFTGIEKDAKKAFKKGKLDKYKDKLLADKYFLDLIKALKISKAEINGILKGASKGG